MTTIVPTSDFDSLLTEAIIRSEIELLARDWEQMQVYRDYYEGSHSLGNLTDKFREIFGTTFDGFRDNWMEVIVEAVAERLEVTGFIPADQDLRGVLDEVWEALRANDIDEQQQELYNGALVEGRAYAIVWPDEDLGFRFDWQPAQNVHVRYDDDDPRRIAWAIKRWRTPMGEVRVTVYFPDRIEKYTAGNPEAEGFDRSESGSTTRATIPESSPRGSLGLRPREVPGERWPLPNPFREVPVVEFANPNGSEIRQHIPQQDMLNATLVKMAIAEEFGAAPQPYIHWGGNEPKGGWRIGPGIVWQFPPEWDSDGKQVDFKAGSFDTAEPDRYISVAEFYLQQIALTSRTPVRYFKRQDRGGRGDAPSGESLKIEDFPLIKKIQKRQTRYGNAWAKVAHLGFKAIQRRWTVPPIQLEPNWEDEQSQYRMALIEEAKGMLELGIPPKFTWKHIGLSESEIEEIERMQEEDESPEPTEETEDEE